MLCCHRLLALQALDHCKTTIHKSVTDLHSSSTVVNLPAEENDTTWSSAIIRLPPPLILYHVIDNISCESYE